MREKGGEIIEALTESASTIRNEISEDAGKVGELVQGAARRVSNTVRPKQIL